MGDASRKRKGGKGAPVTQNIVEISTDYTTGEPRNHHEFYFEDGNFVIQVEKAIFKIHRSLLTRYSTFISGMLDVPNENGTKDGTDEKPLILTGDSVPGWELILGMQYAMPRVDVQPPNGEQMLLVLPIANKYCMDNIETGTLALMKKDTRNDGYVNLIVASRIVGSDELYQAGLNGLIASGDAPSVAQAKLIGAEATQVTMMNVITARDANHTRALAARDASHATALTTVEAELTTALALANPDNRKCKYCQNITNWTCSHAYCRRGQV